MAEGARSGPLLPLLSAVSAPTLLLRADAGRGTLLSRPRLARREAVARRGLARPIEIAGATHEVHRSRFEDFLAAVVAFAADHDSAGAEHGLHVQPQYA